jgi:hypothetical protein
MYIVFCKEISSMGKKFKTHEQGIADMGKYIAECLIKYPKAKIKVENYC